MSQKSWSLIKVSEVIREFHKEIHEVSHALLDARFEET